MIFSRKIFSSGFQVDSLCGKFFHLIRNSVFTRCPLIFSIKYALLAGYSIDFFCLESPLLCLTMSTDLALFTFLCWLVVFLTWGLLVVFSIIFLLSTSWCRTGSLIMQCLTLSVWLVRISPIGLSSQDWRFVPRIFLHSRDMSRSLHLLSFFIHKFKHF